MHKDYSWVGFDWFSGRVNFGLSDYSYHFDKLKQNIVITSFHNMKCTNLYLLIKSVLSCCLVTVNELSTWLEAIRGPSGLEFMI